MFVQPQTTAETQRSQHPAAHTEDTCMPPPTPPPPSGCDGIKFSSSQSPFLWSCPNSVAGDFVQSIKLDTSWDTNGS